MFADKYIQKNKLEKALFLEPVSSDTGIIVVIPCLNEPEVVKTLDSLEQCYLPQCQVEVIVLINHSEKASDSIKKFNTDTYGEIMAWIKNSGNNEIRYLVSKPLELQAKWAGAGLARKKGMDEAVFRFNLINKADGIIVSLDADTVVDKNYLTEIEKHFQSNPVQVGATISFQHQLEGLNEKNREGILLYEKYLKYYKEALSFTGYPFAMYTIGSAFAVLADAYVKRGGMTRRKAGEDFYFLQNLAQQGKVGEINSTRVFPSARPSDRVVFGTGASIKKWLAGTEDLSITYNFQAFVDLKEFFQLKEKLYKITEQEYFLLLKELPGSVAAFVKDDDFYKKLDDLNRNCSSLMVFSRRFFQVFNAFVILKYLNFTHKKFYQKSDLMLQIQKMEN
ncbi:MAG: glycosyltransferase [Prolixibacteraceae bacterium]|nr:glycosyltransferase [Prolixibacteraceae bacterium]